ncbi:structural cement protein Gp24 [Serratia proteamaculans]
MPSLLYRMPVGIAGAISRPQDLTTEPVILNAANTFSQYGLVGKDSAEGKFIPLAASDAATVITGLYVRPYPTTSTPDLVRQVGTTSNFTGDVMKRGYMTVNIGSTAVNLVKGAPVYVRNANPTTGSPLGSILGAAVTDETVVLPNATFTGAGDAAGNAEIAYNI